MKEIARIQTFPDWYEFSRGTSNRSDNAKLDLVYKQIGNAVPVRLALAVAEPIAEFAKKQLEKKDECAVVQKVVEKKNDGIRYKIHISQTILQRNIVNALQKKKAALVYQF